MAICLHKKLILFFFLSALQGKLRFSCDAHGYSKWTIKKKRACDKTEQRDVNQSHVYKRANWLAAYLSSLSRSLTLHKRRLLCSQAENSRVCPCVDRSRMSDFCIVASYIMTWWLRVCSPCVPVWRHGPSIDILYAIANFSEATRLPYAKGHLPLAQSS